MDFDCHGINVEAVEYPRSTLAVLDVFDVVRYRVLVRSDRARGGGVVSRWDDGDEVLEDREWFVGDFERVIERLDDVGDVRPE